MRASGDARSDARSLASPTALVGAPPLPSVVLRLDDAAETSPPSCRLLHVLQLGVGHFAMVDVGIRDVREMPLGSVVEEPLRFEDGDKALALFEPARLGHGAHERLLHVEASAQSPSGHAEEDLAE